jgi:hypothetical protein
MNECKPLPPSAGRLGLPVPAVVDDEVDDAVTEDCPPRLTLAAYFCITPMDAEPTARAATIMLAAS